VFAIKALVAAIGVIGLFLLYMLWFVRGDPLGHTQRMEAKGQALAVARGAVLGCHDGKWCPNRHKGCEKCGPEMAEYYTAWGEMRPLIPPPVRLAVATWSWGRFAVTGKNRPQNKY
jgi:hypothetical protein